MEQDELKILVLGKSSCGKTTFIRAFYDHHSPGRISLENGAIVYRCGFDFEGTFRRVSIVEIPDDIHQAKRLLSLHYDADGFILMYAIDDLSNDRVSKICLWCLESLFGPIIVLGSKKDLRGQQVDEDFEMVIQSFTEVRSIQHDLVYYNIKRYFECSSLNLEEVNEAFTFILNCALDK